MEKRNIIMLVLLIVFVPTLAVVLCWYLIPGFATIATGLNHEVVTLRQLELVLVPMVGYLMAAVAVVLAVNAFRELKCARHCGLLWTFIHVFGFTVAGSIGFAFMAIITGALTNTAVTLSWHLSFAELVELFSGTDFVPALVQINTALFTLGFVSATVIGLRGEFGRFRVRSQLQLQ
jgi:hypothetical protein